MKEGLRLGLLVCLTVLCTNLSFAQDQLVQGTVSDINQLPIPGVNITLKGTDRGTTTDFDGHYEIQASQGEILVFSYVGYRSLETEVKGATLNVTLEESTDALDEVVVTALGISREKKSLGYSVQEVTAESITETPQANLISALSGKVAGAQISDQGGSPGQGTKIIIRGVNSLDPTADNQPLFVIDGVPISNDQFSDGGASRRGTTNRAADINMEDIKSLSVLKGGAATALYGVRAANGAVIIETKRGQEGKTTVNLTTSVSFDEVDKFPKTQNKYTHGYGGVYDTSQLFGNFGPTIEEARAEDPTHPKTLFNNYRRGYQTGHTEKLHLSASGGNKNATFYSSFSKENQDGIMPFTDYKKNSAKIAGDLRVFESLKLSGSVDYVNSGGHRADANNFNTRLVYWAPRVDVRDYEFTEGPLAGTMKGYRNDGHVGNNPIYGNKVNQYVDKVDRFYGNLGFDFNPIENFHLTYRFGLDYYSDNRKATAPGPTGIEGENIYENNVLGYITDTRINSKDLTSNLMASYQTDLSNKFNLTLRAGFDVFQRETDRLTVNGEELDVWDLFHLSNASLITTSQNYNRTRTVGVYGEASLAYDDFLYLTVTDRNDWASTLPKKNRSFNYPSVSLSYLFTENLVNKPDWLTFGKLRGSWAQIGKDAVAAYLTSDVYSATAPGFPIENVTGWTRPGNKADPNLQSELTQEIEFGTELKFFANRLGVDLTWYKSNAKKQILSVPVSITSGYSTFTTNAGEIQNSGLELILYGTPIETPDFSWDVNVNFSNNRNKVKSIREDLGSVLIATEFGYVGANASNRLIVGEPYGTILGTSYKRYYENPNDEDPLHLDKKRPILIGEDGFPVIDSERKILGNSTPDWMMNIGNTFRYKNLSLSFNFDFRQGFVMFNNLDHFHAAFGMAPYTENRDQTIVFDGYLADGTKNTKEVYLGQGVGPDGKDYGDGYYRNTYRYSTENSIEDASWVRLRDLSLTYRFPKNWIEKLSLSNASLTASGHNLWLDTKYSGFDPESTSINDPSQSGDETGNPRLSNVSSFSGRSAFPAIRSYALSLRLTF